MPIKIITDSTSDLPIDLADSLGVTIVPATIIFGQEQFKDRVELTPTQFYERLVSSPVHPTTSAPDIDQFVEAYQSVGSDADGIVSIHVSAKLSATYNAAFQASRQVGLRCPIEVIDSEQASFGLGLAVIAAAKSAAGGADFETVVKAAHSANERSQCVALLDTLEYLQRGGRIGKARALVGSVLRIKPTIIVRDGEVQPLGKARTYTKGMAQIEQTIRDFGPAEELCIMYSTDEDRARQLGESMSDLLPGGAEPIIAPLGPGVGAHVGPGAIGIASLRAS
jgi:DegV family protein with EDD domain